MSYWSDEHKQARKTLCHLGVSYPEATSILKCLPLAPSLRLIEQVLELRALAKQGEEPAPLPLPAPLPKPLPPTSGLGGELIKAELGSGLLYIILFAVVGAGMWLFSLIFLHG